MAKAPAVPGAANAAAASKFSIDKGLSIPTTRGFGKSDTAEEYPFADLDMNDSFLIPVTVAETITDAGEREKQFKDDARKLANKISNRIRTFKKHNADKDFAARTVNDDTLGHGVRVWRVEPKEAAAVPPAPPVPAQPSA